MAQGRSSLRDSFDDLVDSNFRNSIGHLLPLTCGHNGNMNTNEKLKLLFYLRWKIENPGDESIASV